MELNLEVNSMELNLRFFKVHNKSMLSKKKKYAPFFWLRLLKFLLC